MNDNVIRFPGSEPTESDELPKDTPEAPPFGPTVADYEALIGDEVCTGYIILVRLNGQTRLQVRGLTHLEALGVMSLGTNIIQGL